MQSPYSSIDLLPFSPKHKPARVHLASGNCFNDARRAECPAMGKNCMLILAMLLIAGCEKTIRFATYNASLSRAQSGWLLLNLTNPDDPQAKAIADVIQHQKPDVLLLADVDWDYADRAGY